MKKRKRIIIVASVALIGVAGILVARFCGVGSGVVTRTGYLSQGILQHPTGMAIDPVTGESLPQFYFDVGRTPNSGNQIIVAYPKGMRIPTQDHFKIRLKGTIETISFTGGKVGESEYKNDILMLQSWEYLD